MSREAIKCAVIGASGYAGEELVRLLLNHPIAQLVAVTSRQFAGKTLAEVFPRFGGRTKASQLRFTDSKPDKVSAAAEFVLLALPHGVSSGVAKAFLSIGRASDRSQRRFSAS